MDMEEPWERQSCEPEDRNPTKTPGEKLADWEMSGGELEERSMSDWEKEHEVTVGGEYVVTHIV